jgi:hypothetical protein
MECCSSGLFIAGSVPQILVGGVPPVSITDLEARRNRFTYPASWLGLPGTTAGSMARKNTQETKECARCLYDGNFFENSDATGGQKGNLMVTTVRSVSGGNADNYNANITDLTVTNNVLRRGCQGSQEDGRSGVLNSGNSVSGGGERWKFSNNLFYNIQRTLVGCFEPKMNAGTDQGMKFNSGGSTWTGCTASHSGATVTVDCTASVDNIIGHHQHDINPGDLVLVAGCTPTDFNTGAVTQMGVQATPATNPATLIATYVLPTAPSTATATGCSLSNYQGFPRNVTVTHNTVIINYNGTENGSPMDSGSTGAKPIFSQRFLIKNNIGIGGGFGHTSIEGTTTETTQWDANTFEFHHNVWPSRTASKYTDFLTQGGGGTSPPTKSYFPASTFCSGFADSTCLGMIGETQVSSFDHNLVDWHNYGLCRSTNTSDPACSTPSFFSFGQGGQADDGTDMGFDPGAIDAAQTATKYQGCAGNCGATGPFDDNGTTTPFPIAALTPDPLDFGNKVISVLSAGQDATLTNSGTATLNISGSPVISATAQSCSAPGDFAVTAQTCGSTLGFPPAANTCTYTVKVTPSALSARCATLTVTDDATPSTQSITLQATGISAGPSIRCSPGPPDGFDFGSIAIGNTSPTTLFTCQNQGSSNLVISSVVLTTGNSNNFALSSNNCVTTVPAGGNCTFRAAFAPLSPIGAKSSIVRLSHNAAPIAVTTDIPVKGSATSGGGAVTLFPQLTGTGLTIPRGAQEPISCDIVGGGHNCIFSIQSATGALGTISPNGIYQAPNSDTTVTIKATSGANTATTTIQVSGAMATLTGTTSFPSGTANCNDTASGGFPNTYRGIDAMSVCTTPHQEVGGTLTRKMGVVIPQNYVPCGPTFINCSGLIVVLGNGGHGLGNTTTGGACAHPGSETSGIASYVHTVPSPGPVVLCLEAAFKSGTLEFWNPWNLPFNQTWAGITQPLDDDFARIAVFAIWNNLHLNPKATGIFTDWNTSSVDDAMISEIAAVNSDQIAVVMTYNDAFLANVNTDFTVGSGTQHAGFAVPVPNGPVSIISLPGRQASLTGNVISTNVMSTMCGNDLATVGTGCNSASSDH